jgi:DNA-binding beta-propeller fold protein YncE
LDGLRLAREALAISHPVTAGSTIDQGDVKGQLVEVLDAADGKVVLETAASPILDGGGNVAISPSGRRVAVLNGGAIQVFVLPAPTPLLEPSSLAPAAHQPSP